MNEIVAGINELISIGNCWLQLTEHNNNTISLLENIAENVQNTIVQILATVNKIAGVPEYPSISAIIEAHEGVRNVSPDITRKINLNSPEYYTHQAILENKENVVEKAIGGTLETLTESSLKTLVRKGNKTFYDVFKTEFKTGMKDVAKDIAGDAAQSLLRSMGAEELLAGGIGSILEGAGAALLPEFVLPAIAIGYIAKEIFFNDPKPNKPSTTIIPLLKNSRSDYIGLINDMVNKGEIVLENQYYADKNKHIQVYKSTAEDFSMGNSTNISFRDRETLHYFKRMYDPKNQETGWTYQPYAAYKTPNQDIVSYSSLFETGIRRGLEELYKSYGSRGAGYVDRKIIEMKQLVGNGPYKANLDRILTGYYSFVNKSKPVSETESKLQHKQSRRYIGAKNNFVNQSGRSVIININKPFIETFTINAKEIKEGLSDFKQKVEQVFLEILNSAEAAN